MALPQATDSSLHISRRRSRVPFRASGWSPSWSTPRNSKNPAAASAASSCFFELSGLHRWRWVDSSRVRHYLPASILLFLPDGDVLSGLGDVDALRIFPLELPCPQAVGQVARLRDIDLDRLPRQLIGGVEVFLQSLSHFILSEGERCATHEVGRIVRKERQPSLQTSLGPRLFKVSFRLGYSLAVLLRR